MGAQGASRLHPDAAGEEPGRRGAQVAGRGGATAGPGACVRDACLLTAPAPCLPAFPPPRTFTMWMSQTRW